LNLLALSTSGPCPSAALFQEGALIHEQVGLGGKTHSETLMPLVEQVLACVGLLPNEIDVFAVDIGPGSFTGVRIGVCAANAMALSKERPVIGVSSLRALLYGIEGPACALLDCRNGNGYAMVLGQSGEILLPESAVVVAELLHETPAGTLFVGDGAELYKEAILQTVPGARFCQDNAVTAAKVGCCAAGLEGSREALPLYLRPSQAERLFKEKRV